VDLKNIILELRSELTLVDRAIGALEQISAADQSEPGGLAGGRQRNPRTERKIRPDSARSLTMSAGSHST